MTAESTLPQQHGAVIVTGAAGGIGAAIAARCARNGWDVIAADLHAPPATLPSRDDEAARVHPLAVDIADPAGPQRLLDAAADLHLPLVGLVNCAGIMRRGSMATITEADWTACFAVNVDAPFRLCRAALPALSAAGGGAIVNIASQWGLHPARNHVAYNASKAALISLTRSIARDQGDQRIRANAVCPGEVLTPMVEQKMRDSGTTESELAALVPVGRLGRPDDIADLTAFLLSGQAGYINGATIEITGGQTVA